MVRAVRLVQTRYLNNGAGFNRGQPATLIQIEKPEDYDTLLENILRSGYYDGAYFERQSGYRTVAGLLRERPRLRPLSIPRHFWFVAEMVRWLGPRSVLEVGCGRADVLALLAWRGVEVLGTDFSPALQEQVWPELREHMRWGDFAEVCLKLKEEGRRFDTLCAFDIWEHVHPAALERYIQALAQVATDDALFLCIIPAFGKDRIFGEQFPLEFEENRARFEAEEVFDFLLAERVEPIIPASGHLIWAHTRWWERRFAAHGLHREEALERVLHAHFDKYLSHSVRAFFVLSKRTEGSAARVARALEHRPGPAFEVEAALRHHVASVRGRIGPWVKRLRRG